MPLPDSDTNVKLEKAQNNVKMEVKDCNCKKSTKDNDETKVIDTFPYEETLNVFEYGFLFSCCAILYHTANITPFVLVIFPIAIIIGNYNKVRGCTNGVLYMIILQALLTYIGYRHAYDNLYRNSWTSFWGAMPLDTGMEWFIGLSAAFLPYLICLMVYFGQGLYRYSPYPEEEYEEDKTGESKEIEAKNDAVSKSLEAIDF